MMKIYEKTERNFCLSIIYIENLVKSIFVIIEPFFYHHIF